MTERVIPRCPNCNKRMANWISGEASFKCDNNHCETEFEIRDGKVFILAKVAKVLTHSV